MFTVRLLFASHSYSNSQFTDECNLQLTLQTCPYQGKEEKPIV